jgi:hypothetical protein
MRPRSLKVYRSGTEDGNPWQHLLPLTLYGIRYTIHTNDLGVLTNIVDYLPPRSKWCAAKCAHQTYSLLASNADPTVFLGRHSARGPYGHLSEPALTPSGSSSRINADHTTAYALYCGSTCLICSDDLSQILLMLESHLNIFVAAWAHRRLFVHAGVVQWRNVAIILPGRSFTGKTTLVHALISAGARYYSDEYAVFDSDGRVHAFQRPLSIRDNYGGQKRRLKVPRTDAGGAAIPVGLIVNCCYREGAAWSVTPVSSGAAMLALLANTVPARHRPVLALSILSKVVRNAKTVTGVRGDAEDAVCSVLSLVQ